MVGERGIAKERLACSLTPEFFFIFRDFGRGLFLRQILSCLTSAQISGFSTSLQLSGVYMGQSGCFFDMD